LQAADRQLPGGPADLRRPRLRRPAGRQPGAQALERLVAAPTGQTRGGASVRDVGMNKEKLVVVGNGMAGCRAVEEILKRAPNRYEIAIFGAEPRVNYNRIMLSPVLAGEKTFEDIVINDEAWYRDNGITLHAGRT